MNIFSFFLISSSPQAVLLNSSPLSPLLLTPPLSTCLHAILLVNVGSITIEGTKTSLVPDFVRQTLYLSQYLNVSERYAASLLQAGMENRVEFSRTSLETACILFHGEKIALLGTLKELLLALQGVQNQDEESLSANSWELGSQLEDFLASLVETDVPTAKGGHTNLVRSLLDLLDSITDQIQNLTQRLQNGFVSQPGVQSNDDLDNEALALLEQESQDAGLVLVLLALTGKLRTRDTQSLLEWLTTVTTSRFGAHAIYILTTALSALESQEISDTLADLVTSPERWKTPAIGSALALRWIVTNVEMLPNLAGSTVDIQRQENRLQTLASQTIQSGVFAFLSLDVLTFRTEQRKDHVWQPTSDEGTPAIFSSGVTRSVSLSKGQLSPAFQPYVLHQVQKLVLDVTSMMLNQLKRIQRSEEEAAFITSRGRASTGAAVETGASQCRNDIQQLFDLIATLCSDRPEAGLDFWTGSQGKIMPFLLWAIETRDTKNQLSLIDMLGALATGSQSATHAYHLLANESGGTRLITWSRLFDWLQYYLDAFQKAAPNQEMDPGEVNQLVAFLHLLRNVVYHSQEARMHLYQSSELNAVPTLFRLSLLHIHADLKAALFESLAAFARRDNPGAARVGKEIWSLVSSTDLLGTGQSSWNSVLGRQVNASGAIYQLEHIEAERKVYPSSTALVAFLTALIPYVPEGTDAYVTFVVQNVFLKIPSREYASPSDRSKITVACLEFFHRCLMEFHLELEPGTQPNLVPHPDLEPGFLIAKDILLNESLAKEIFALLTTDFETLNRPSSTLLTQGIKLAMQCLKRVFELQDKFLRDLLPFLTDASHDLSRLGTIANYAPLDQHLLYSSPTVVAIALYINADSLPVAMLSIHLMGYLASSASFSAPDRFSLAGGRKQLNRLAGLLEMMGETPRVRAGYMRRLAQSDAVSAGANEDGSDESSFDPEASASAAFSPFHSGSIRVAILNFLISHNRLQPPNVAHLLLGYDISSTAPEAPPLPDPTAPTTHGTVLSTILSLIRPDDGSLSTILAQHPDLTERCFQLLLDLCSEPYSSSATLHYLRTYENFMVSHLPAIPFAPTEREQGMGFAVYRDLTKVQTSVNAVLANLRIKASLLEMVALQIHAVTNAGMMNLALPLVGILLDPQGSEGVQMIHMLRSMSFVWHDERDPLRSELTLLLHLNDDMARSADGASFDLDKAQATILLARKEMRNNGELEDQESREAFNVDSARWIRWMVAQNAHHSINLARRLALKNWRHALGMILSRCGSLLRSEERINVLFTILTTLLPEIISGTDPAIVETISGAVLELIASLRITAKEGANARYDMFPTERILTTLRALVSSILLPGTSMFARGNLYTALINFLQFANKEEGQVSPLRDDAPDGKEETSSAGSVLNSSGFVSGQSVQPGAAIILRVRMTLSEKIDQLVMRVAKDALDAADVWKAVSYTLLDKLTGLEHNPNPQRSRALGVLVKQGYLKAMVSALRDSDLALQACLSPDPPTLVALYVYSAQMSFFVRLATSRGGVETLLDLGLIPILAQADFIAASPESNQGFTGMEGFLPAARERYAELVAPALELVTSMLSVAPVAGDAVAGLLTSQGEAVSELLQNVLSNIVSIGQVRQANLLIILLGLLADQQPSPLAGNAPNYHHQLLAVTAGFLTKPAWARRVLASNDEEVQQQLQVVARDGQTAFDRKVLLAVERLQQAVLVYLEAVSRPTFQGATAVAPIKPVLTSSLAAQQDTTSVGEAALQPPLVAQRPNSTASLGTAVQALDEEFEKLSVRVARLDKVLTATANPTTVSLDDLEELLGIEGTLSSLDLTEAAGQPALASHLLRRRARTIQGSIAHSLGVIELLLVLLYRHFDFYLSMPDAQLADEAAWNGTVAAHATLGAGFGTGVGAASGRWPNGGMSPLPTTLSNVLPLRPGGAPQPKVDKQLISRFGLDKVAALIDRAVEIALHPTHLTDAPERGAFIEMLLRKIQQVLLQPAQGV